MGTNASPDARADFVARKVDAAVLWEPDVREALQKRTGSHVLVSSKGARTALNAGPQRAGSTAAQWRKEEYNSVVSFARGGRE